MNEESNNVIELGLRADSPIRLQQEIDTLKAEMRALRGEKHYYELKTEAIMMRYAAIIEVVSVMINHDPNEITEDGRTVLEVWRETARQIIWNV